MQHLLGKWKLERYFASGLRPRAEASLRLHLRGCERCRDRYRRHLVAESLLPDGDRLAEDRLWHGICSASATARPSPLWMVSALAFGAVAALLVLAPRLRTAPVERGSGAPVPGPLTPAIHLYRLQGRDRTIPVVDHIAARDALLVAYSNPGPDHDHLMVFAVDERYHVFWFYPAFLHPGEDPAAIAIDRGRAGVELGEQISHDYIPGKLRVYALFLEGSARVSRIEQLIEETMARPRVPLEREVPLPLAGAYQQAFLLEVDR
jgi:hypothetical protein